MYNLPAGITNSWRILLSSTSNRGGDAVSFKGRAKGPKTISPSRTCGLGCGSTKVRWIDVRNRLDALDALRFPPQWDSFHLLPCLGISKARQVLRKLQGQLVFTARLWWITNLSQKKETPWVLFEVTHITIRQLHFWTSRRQVRWWTFGAMFKEIYFAGWEFCRLPLSPASRDTEIVTFTEYQWI